MKSISLLAIFMFLIMGTAYSQIESFEDETDGATSFTVNGLNFTTTGNLVVEVIPNYGCGQSDSYLKSGVDSSGSFGSIKVTNSGDKFTVSTLDSWCLYLSNNGGQTGTSGDIKFTGTLSTGGTIEEPFHVDHTQSSFDDITFSTGIWDDEWLTELEVSRVSAFSFLALDNIVFENLIVPISNIQEEEIKIYPNPTAGEIVIIGIDDSEVKIIDAFGRIVKEQSLFNQKIDISGLVDGIYYISINTHNQQITKRIIKH